MEIVNSRVVVDKDKRWSDTQDRLAAIREEVTNLLFECGHRIDKPLIDDIAVIVFNKQVDAFYKTDLSFVK